MIDFVYILSASHSGSTLLTLLLDSHPQVTTVGETSAAAHESGGADTGFCSCGAELEACPFWRQVREEMQRRGVDWEAPGFRLVFRTPESRIADRWLRAEYRDGAFEALRDGLLAVSPAWRRAAPRLYEANRTLIETVMALRGGKVFVDSSKEPHRLKYLMRIQQLRPRVIHLVRDGRGVSASYRRKGMPMAQAVDEWRRSIESEEHVLRRFSPRDVAQIRYEDLCSNVESEMRRLWRFMGLDDSCGLSGWPPRDHHVLGNRMRLSAASAIRLDERWREDLGPEELAVFEQCAGALNRRYGYEPAAAVRQPAALGQGAA